MLLSEHLLLLLFLLLLLSITLFRCELCRFSFLQTKTHQVFYELYSKFMEYFLTYYFRQEDTNAINVGRLSVRLFVIFYCLHVPSIEQ